MAKLKFKVGDMVYSWQNPTVKRRISHTRQQPWGFVPKYKVSLRDKDGYSYSSKWIDETSVSKVRRRKK